MFTNRTSIQNQGQNAMALAVQRKPSQKWPAVFHASFTFRNTAKALILVYGYGDLNTSKSWQVSDNAA